MAYSKSSLRIDWFDGSLIEETRQNTSSTSRFQDEEVAEPEARVRHEVEKKPIGFKRLFDISQLKPPILNLEISNRPGFWHLLDTDLKGDFIVLITRILSNAYNNLEVCEKSKLKTLLKTRFIKSNFVNNLKMYLEGLPNVKIVEKRMNMQLWDDIETFFFTVYELCYGMFKFHENEMEVLMELLDLLQITETSATGVKEEHMETIRENFFTKIGQLKENLLSRINQECDDLSSKTQPCNKDPTNYKILKILPSKDDLIGNSNVIIEPNIINGAYSSVEHYLDLQFKLLREDFFAPLREGISKYMQNPSKQRHENIRVYSNVRIIRTHVTNNRVGHLVDIVGRDRGIGGLVDKQHYASNKRLLHGSLLLFTADYFETILCATVLDSNSHLLADGYIVVAFENPVSNKIFSEFYLMVESEVFFEPYHRVLKVLQNISSNDLPMKKYIVDIQSEPQPPKYLKDDTMYTTCNAVGEEISFPVLDCNHWPSKEIFGLDDSQMSAYQFALTREFAVIQGPPGTGKTFIGIKIASTLLNNLSLEGTPMLIICYTNHALDQFLEGVLGITDNVIRLGGQSKSKLLQSYTLSNARGRIKSKYSYLYANKKAELERLYKEMTELQTEIEKCEKEIVSYRVLKPYLKIGTKNYELKISDEDSVVSWLFGHLGGNNKEESELEEWEKQSENLDISDAVDTCFSEESALNDIESMNRSLKYVDEMMKDEEKSQEMKIKLGEKITLIRKRLDYFRKMLASYRTKQAENEIAEVKDLYDLHPEDRWHVYFTVINALTDKLVNKMNGLMEKHRTCSEELEEVCTLLDGEVVKGARVVGATTTAAARNHNLLRMLHSPIALVEEAAEVLETHIVASLTSHCQHLILIGDHKQLRPTTAHYRLAQEYHLDISLFERALHSGVHGHTLRTQRRMREEVARLLVPQPYAQLDTHPTARTYPDVRGVNHNLYFLNHNVHEDSEGLDDSWSHKNSHEARWCIGLANYLRQMGYTAEDITILTAYTGQATLIRDLSKKYELLQNVRVTVIDNYQGEENRIVILSLVRSNKEGSIGFLSAGNRVCVAMSRAREGFYIFGNMDVLQAASSLWKSIGDKLRAQKALGDKMLLHCEKHKENIYSVRRYQEFDNCFLPNGVCLKSCNISKV